MTYMATPYIRITALESLNLQFWQTLIWSSLIYILSASLSDSMPGSREDFLKKCINFKLFTPKLSPLMDGSGNLQFLVSLPYRCYIPNLVKFGPVVSEEEMLMHDARRTTHHDGCQPIAIGHLSDSGDLKTKNQIHHTLRGKQTTKPIDRLKCKALQALGS